MPSRHYFPLSAVQYSQKTTFAGSTGGSAEASTMTGWTPIELPPSNPKRTLDIVPKGLEAQEVCELVRPVPHRPGSRANLDLAFYVTFPPARTHPPAPHSSE